MSAENAESVEEEVVEDQLVEEVEAEEVPETEEAETEQVEDEEVEVVLEGEEEPAPHKMPRRVVKLLERNTVLQSDLENQGQANTAQSQEIERLKQELATQQQNISIEMPMPPVAEDFDFDQEKIAQATQQYKVNMQQWLTNNQQTVSDTNAQTVAQSQIASKEKSALEEHYKRADSLKVPDYDDSEAAVMDVLGRNALKAIAMTLPNSAMVINYLGKNPAKLQEMADLDKVDPSAGVAKLWEYNFGLKARPRKRSNAPEPEQRVEGGVGGSISALQKKYDKATDEGDIKTRRKLRVEAKEKGITLED